MSDFAELAGDLSALESLFDDERLGSIVITNKAYARNRLGQFARHVKEADARATDAAGRRGAEVMRMVVPKKSGRLASTIRWSHSGTTTGSIYFGDGAPYWRYVAYGARPHPITGWVRFMWEKAGRMWEPGPNVISHPGTRPHPFIQTAYYAAQLELEGVMRREYRDL